MSRPIYERDTDRHAEAALAREIADRWGVTCLTLPKLATADLLICNPDMTFRCWAEIKTRQIEFGTYRCLHLSLDKVHRLQRLADLTRVRVIIIANLIDGAFAIPCPPMGSHIVTEQGGRTDRNDAKDVEEMACLFWPDFTRII